MITFILFGAAAVCTAVGFKKLSAANEAAYKEFDEIHSDFIDVE